MPELADLKVKQAEVEEKAADTDVAAAMSSYGLHEATKEALLLFRSSQPEKFAEKFPPKDPKTVPTPAHLTSSMVATPSGSQISPTGEQVPGGSTDEINLDGYQGRNPTEKAQSYLAATHKGWEGLTDQARWKLAVALKRQSNVKFTPIQMVAG